MTTLKERFCSHMKLSKGGYSYGYEILDGEKVVGMKHSGRADFNTPVSTVFVLGDQEFKTAAEFIAAYGARKAKAA